MRGFEYSDCWVDDARLVLANAQMVVRKGGEVRTVPGNFLAKRAENGLWIVEAEDIDTGENSPPAGGLVEMTGPWVKHFDEGCICAHRNGIRPIKGINIVVPRAHQKQAYILQNEDKRIVFRDPVDG